MKKALSLVLAIVLVMALSVAASATTFSSTQIKNGTPVVDGVLDEIYTQSASASLDTMGFYCWGDGLSLIHI